MFGNDPCLDEIRQTEYLWSLDQHVGCWFIALGGGMLWSSDQHVGCWFIALGGGMCWLLIDCSRRGYVLYKELVLLYAYKKQWNPHHSSFPFCWPGLVNMDNRLVDSSWVCMSVCVDWSWGEFATRVAWLL